MGVMGLVALGDASDEELSRASNVGCHVRVHGVLAQKIDAEFLARLGEAQQAVQGEHIGEDATSFRVVRHPEKLYRGIPAAFCKDADFGTGVPVVDSSMLLVKNCVEDVAPEPLLLEHLVDDGTELDEPVV